MSLSSNRVAANTIIMYVRMLLLIFIAFYSSRLLLNSLGVNDFGIQSVVGSISSTFLSLRSLFSEALQRYLNYEKGKNSLRRQVSVFNIGIVIHAILAILFVIISEPVGCWLIGSKLDIPLERTSTAFFIFHMSIISVFISIFSIPFDALIIANEKMGIFALITVIDSCLRLGAVMLLDILTFDKLRLYSVLLLAIPIFTLLSQIIYCRKFPECRINKKVNKELLKGVISLSGWNFMGNMAFSLLHEGVNMLLNVFGGLAYNAARTISYQVKSVASQISYNTMIAVRPRFIQQSAVIDKIKMFENINTISRISFFTIILPIIVLLSYTEKLLDIWLVNIPEHTVLFTRLLLVSVIVRSLHEPLNMMYMALGNIKRMTIVEVLSMTAFLLFIYLSLKMGAPLWTAYVEMGAMECVIIAGLVINAKYEYDFTVKRYLIKVIIPMFSVVVGIFFICYLFNHYLSVDSLLDLIMYSLCLCFVYCFFIILLLDSREINIIKSLIYNIPYFREKI